MTNNAVPKHWYLRDTDEFAAYLSELVQAKLRGRNTPGNAVPLILPSINIPVQQTVYAALLTDQICAAFHNRSWYPFISLNRPS